MRKDLNYRPRLPPFNFTTDNTFALSSDTCCTVPRYVYDCFPRLAPAVRLPSYPLHI